jgi:hypothetical protein
VSVTRSVDDAFAEVRALAARPEGVTYNEIVTQLGVKGSYAKRLVFEARLSPLTRRGNAQAWGPAQQAISVPTAVPPTGSAHFVESTGSSTSRATPTEAVEVAEILSQEKIVAILEDALANQGAKDDRKLAILGGALTVHRARLAAITRGYFTRKPIKPLNGIRRSIQRQFSRLSEVRPRPPRPDVNAAESPPDSPPRLLWVWANNEKTGETLTAYVYPLAAAQRSCQGCALYDPQPGAPRCYAYKRAKMRLRVMERQLACAKKTFDFFSLERRLNSRRGRRAIVVLRLTAIGDALHLPEIRDQVRAVIALARQRGLVILAYTHFWKLPENQEFKGAFMASCNDLAQADEAIDLGWTPAVVLGPTTPKAINMLVRTPMGRSIMICPQQAMPSTVTCESCKLCSPAAKLWCGRKSGPGFVEH